MNSYKYGTQHFKYKTNFGNIVVYSDEEKPMSLEEGHPKSDNQYVHIYRDEEADIWIAKPSDVLSGEYGDFIIAKESLSAAGSINISALPVGINVSDDFGDTTMDYYLIQGNYYLQISTAIQLDEVVFTIANNSGKKEFTPQEEAYITLFVFG